MLPINALPEILKGLLTSTKVKILVDLIKSFFTVRYGTTTKNLSRYSNTSLRTLFRFLKEPHDWLEIRIKLFGTLCFKKERIYIAAIDETVEGKSRKNSHGIGRFFSSIQGQPIVSVCFFALSLIDVVKRTSHMIGCEQVVYTDEDKARIKKDKAAREAAKMRAKKGQALPKGRKKGTKNQVAGKKPNETASFRAFNTLFTKAMDGIRRLLTDIKLTHLVADSAYSSLDYLSVAQSYKCFLISVLKNTAALFAIAPKVDGAKGRPKKYGKQYDLKNLPLTYLKKTNVSDNYKEETFQFQAYSKTIGGLLLNIVVIKMTNLNTNKTAVKVFFSNDLSLDWETLLDYYALRFQIEFDFRDAKQHFGLSDFKNYKKENLTNFVNLSFLMCLLSKPVIAYYREKTKISQLGLIDVKSIFHAQFIAQNLFNMVENDGFSIFNSDFIANYLPNDLIHRA
jgi:putative transposase